MSRNPVRYAISSQSAKAVRYVNAFFRRIRKYLEHNGWAKTSDNQRKIEWVTDKGENVAKAAAWLEARQGRIATTPSGRVARRAVARS